jgi:hypothetical protein
MSFPVIDSVEVGMAPPAGYNVDFANPTVDTATVNASYVAFGIMFPVAFLFLSSRMYTALFVLRKFQIDDCKTSSP